MKLFFHLGYTRTGTTFLQKYIFPKHRDINYLGAKNFYDSNQVKISQYKLDLLANLYTKLELDQGKIDLNKIEEIIDYKIFSEEKINLISSERYLHYLNSLNDFNDIKIISHYCKKKYKKVDLHFVLVLRNQYDLIKSVYFFSYAILSKELGIKTFDQLISLFDKNIEQSFRTFRFLLFTQYYNFNFIYDKIKENFKDSPIKILFYEDLNDNKKEYMRDFSDFLNVDNEITMKLSQEEKYNELKKLKDVVFFTSPWKYNLSQNYLFNIVKQYIPKPLKNTLKKLTQSKEKIISETEKKLKVLNYYRESNDKFFKKVNLINKYNKNF